MVLHIRPGLRSTTSDNPPCSCAPWSEKGESAWMSNCPQNTMQDWFAALFSLPGMALLGGELNGETRGWNKDVLSAGKKREEKLPILEPVHQAWKMGKEEKRSPERERTVTMDYGEEKGPVYTHLNGVTIPEQPWIIKRLFLLLHKALQSRAPCVVQEEALHLVCMGTKGVQQKINIMQYQACAWIRNAWEGIPEKTPRDDDLIWIDQTIQVILCTLALLALLKMTAFVWVYIYIRPILSEDCYNLYVLTYIKAYFFKVAFAF